MMSGAVDNPQLAESLQEILITWVERSPAHPLLGNAKFIVDLATSSAPHHRLSSLAEAQFLLQVIPQYETDALHLDLAVIHHVVTLLTGQPTLDRLIIPVYDEGRGRSWRHQERYLPLKDGRLPVHLIFMDREQEPDLRTYVWLVHELVHVVLARHLSLFTPGSHMAARRVQEWRLTSLASDDSASEQLAAEFWRYWSPGRDQEDWPHEIAVDTICMWLLGPAYAEALHRHYREAAASIPAYLIEPSHIPLELRTQAMIRMGEYLGWGRVMQPLRELQTAWKRQWPQAARASRYRALRDDVLIQEAQRAALSFCEDHQLQPLTPGLLASITKASSNVDTLNGIELIIAAWWVERQEPEHEYRAWAARAVRSYADDA